MGKIAAGVIWRYALEPLTAVAYGSLAIWRLVSASNRRRAREEYETAVWKFNTIAQDHQVEAASAFDAMASLGERRVSHMRTLLRRILVVSTKLPELKPFDPECGWFCGAEFDKVNSLILATDRMTQLDLVLEDNGASWTAIVANGISLIKLAEAIDLINGPDLPQHLHALTAGHPVSESVASLASNLDLADLEMLGHMLGPLTLLWGAGRGIFNFTQARDLRESASAVWCRTEEAKREVARLSKIRRRAQAINTALDDAAYAAFKSVWLAERMLEQRDRETLLTNGTGASVRDATKRLWACLNVRLLTRGGRATSGAFA